MSQRQVTIRRTLEARLRRCGALALCVLGAMGSVVAAAPSAVVASPPTAVPSKFAAVSDERLRHAASEPGEWFTGGRDGQGTYYSPLEQINSGNITQLGFAWEYRLGAVHRGLEATPLVVDGVMYTSGQRGVVYALDARTGKEIWTFDPQIDLQYMRYACCDAVNRGVAIKNGVVYVGALDGRLFALDAATGKPRWIADTIVDQRFPHTITGAPQLTKDLVVIGNSGSESIVGGARGYVSAYDLETGELRWRFYTVPELGEKNPAPEMVAAAKTWDPKRDPRILGGGMVWDGMAYDPDLNLLYFGTANPVPNDQISRGGGDNLYTASIIAVDAATGRMAWYYQTTPGDIWDYDAVQKMILVDLTLNGRPRKVLMQANKNGYFYVIDRKTGKVVSAKPFTYLNWSKGMDAHFRPIINPQADFTRKIILIYPAAAGAHSWQPMSYSPKTGLVYIPVFHALNVVGKPENAPAPEKSFDGTFRYYWASPSPTYDLKAAEAEFGKMPDFNPVDPKTGHSVIRSVLTAWNPVTQREAWSQPVSEGFESMEGGVMSTAGNLVFQGTSTGELRIYAADSGKPLLSIPTGTAIMAAPCTYMVDDVQYVAVMGGFGGDAFASPLPPKSAPAHYDNAGRILVFRLGGGPEVPRTAERVIGPLPVPPPREGSAADIAAGGELYGSLCERCHGGGLPPNLKRMEGGVEQLDTFKLIVLQGALAANGMERFDDVLKPHDVEQIHAYLVDQAHKLYDKENAERP